MSKVVLISVFKACYLIQDMIACQKLNKFRRTKYFLRSIVKLALLSVRVKLLLFDVQRGLKRQLLQCGKKYIEDDWQLEKKMGWKQLLLLSQDTEFFP